MNDVRGEAFFYFLALHSTPRTFRIIIGTNTNELKCGYGQLPRQEADTDSHKISDLKLLGLSWTPLRALCAASSWRRIRMKRNTTTARYLQNRCSLTSKVRNMSKCITEASAFLVGPHASRHVSYIDWTDSNCAARNYFTSQATADNAHETVATQDSYEHVQLNHFGHGHKNHLGLRTCDLTQGLKPSPTTRTRQSPHKTIVGMCK